MLLNPHPAFADARKRCARVMAAACLAALFWATAQAQSPEATETGADMPSRTAVFYEDPQVLNQETHRDLRLKLPGNAAFAAGAQAVPILATEFPDVAREYPIVFVKGADEVWMALALTGLEPGRNLFVDADGTWTASYIPASVRRYPFVAAGDGNGGLSVAVDMALASEDEDAVALFTAEGAPAPVLQNAIAFLQSFQGQSQATSALIGRMLTLDLLVPAQFQLRDGAGAGRTLDGFFIVEEARLAQLRDDTVLDLFRQGRLPLIQAHLLSLRSLADLQRRQAAALPN